jgi:glycogen(starch) synthase
MTDTPVAPERPLNLCVVALSYYQDPWCGGLSTYYFNLVCSLCELGHRVFLVIPEGSVSPERPPNCEVIPIRAQPMFAEHAARSLVGGLARVARRFWFSCQVLRRVRQLEHRAHLDLVLAPELFAPALLIALFGRHKLITRLHTPSHIGDEFNERHRFRWIRQLPSFLEKVQVKRSAGFSAASRRLASAIAKDWRIPTESIRVIPNSVQVDWVRGLAATARKELPGRYLLYFGRLERRKGVHILSRSLGTVLSERPDLSMVFVGRDCGLKDDILRDNLPFHDRLLFLDTMDKGRLFGVIRFADLVILPSLFENFSNAGLEALALGRPIIGTYGTAFEECIEDGVNGFLVEPGDAAALTRKILSCLARPDLDRIGHGAHQTALRFDWRAIALQNVEFYRATLRRPRVASLASRASR